MEISLLFNTPQIIPHKKLPGLKLGKKNQPQPENSMKSKHKDASSLPSSLIGWTSSFISYLILHLKHRSQLCLALNGIHLLMDCHYFHVDLSFVFLALFLQD